MIGGGMSVGPVGGDGDVATSVGAVVAGATEVT